MSCPGPDHTKWDGLDCISTSNNTSCDSVNQTTCYYADCQFGGGGGGLQANGSQYTGGQFVDKDATSGDFRVDLPGPLADLGVKEGDIVSHLNGKKPNARTILSFNEKNPAKGGSCLRSSEDSRIEVCLWR